MKNILKIRFVWSNWMPFLSGIVFIWLFYLFYFMWWAKVNIEILSYSFWDFAEKYSIFIPLFYWILSIFVLYLLYLIKWIIRANFWIVNLVLLLVVFWFNLFFWIQLVYFEPRFTDVAKFLIDTFWKSLMYASIWSIFFILISIFISKKV